MKKLFAIAAMAVACLSANAQQQAKGTFSLMPKVGLGYTNVTNLGSVIDLNGKETKFGDCITVDAGVEAKYQISELFGVSAGVEYVMMKSTNKVSYSNIDFCPQFDYIAVPILAQFNLGSHFGAKLGIQPAFKSQATSGNSDYDAKSVVWSIPVGVSWTFNSPVVLDLRCNIPVSRLNKDDVKGLNSKATSILLTIGYRIDGNLKKAF